MKYALDNNISYINIDIKTDKWTITEWFTKTGYMNKGYGTKIFKIGLNNALKVYGKPQKIVYVWNNENEYVYKWLKKFDAKCTCPISVLKYSNEDIWESHLYELNVKKVLDFIQEK